MTKKLLTAIIFTYNHCNTIENCIRSIVHQKTTYPYEIQIWDDCSIDGTSDICRKYASKYPHKIKYYRQNKNTFTGPYNEMQSYAAIRNIHTKYWCVIDGDDWWCCEDKIQIALDFLEKHPEYVGFAHDTNYLENHTKNSSYIHGILGVNPKSTLQLSPDTPFFLTSSRIFRHLGYEKDHVLPIDYQIYWWHVAQGPIYYLDKCMATYNISEKSTFASNVDEKLVLMQPYKILQTFKYEHDNFCTELLRKYLIGFKMSNKLYIYLKLLKALFGKKKGWDLWYYFTFVPTYGKDCMNISYVYSNRKKVKQISDTIGTQPVSPQNTPLEKVNNIIEEMEIDKEIRLYKIASQLKQLLTEDCGDVKKLKQQIGYLSFMENRYKKRRTMYKQMFLGSLFINLMLGIYLFVR